MSRNALFLSYGCQKSCPDFPSHQLNLNQAILKFSNQKIMWFHHLENWKIGYLLFFFNKNYASLKTFI